MPFKSDAQRKYLFAKEPKVAKEFAAHTPKGAKLPEHVKKSSLNHRLTVHLLARQVKQAGLADLLGSLQKGVLGAPGVIGKTVAPYLSEAVNPVASGVSALARGTGRMGQVAGKVAPALNSSAHYLNAAAAGPGSILGPNAARNVGLGAIGTVGGLTALGMSGKKEPQQMEQQASEQGIGTAFTDGLLAYCAHHKLGSEKVIDLFEKGAQAEGRVGEECKNFLERLTAVQS